MEDAGQLVLGSRHNNEVSSLHAALSVDAT
jgi:hypothetical protein